jgi:hypothetical protein
MNGYSDVFDTAMKQYTTLTETTPKETLFRNFRSDHVTYGFIHNCDNPPEAIAVSIAKETNTELYEKYVENNKNKIQLGYDSFSRVHATYDELDSRHIMMSVILFNTVKGPFDNVVEIGGGFGNWLRLNKGVQSFRSWTILDLPHLLELQQWFHRHHGLDAQYVSAFDYEKWASSQEKIDLVIGTHSLSEFSLVTFTNYYYSVIKKARYFFYAYHRFAHKLLTDTQLQIIQKDFRLVVDISSENGNVGNCVFVSLSNE